MLLSLSPGQSKEQPNLQRNIKKSLIQSQNQGNIKDFCSYDNMEVACKVEFGLRLLGKRSSKREQRLFGTNLKRVRVKANQFEGLQNLNRDFTFDPKASEISSKFRPERSISPSKATERNPCSSFQRRSTGIEQSRERGSKGSNSSSFNGKLKTEFENGCIKIREMLTEFSKPHPMTDFVQTSLNARANLLFCQFLETYKLETSHSLDSDLSNNYVENYSPLACLLIIVKMESQRMTHNFSRFLKSLNKLSEPCDLQIVAKVEKMILFKTNFQIPKDNHWDTVFQDLSKFSPSIQYLIQWATLYSLHSKISAFSNFQNLFNQKVQNLFKRIICDSKLILRPSEQLSQICFEEIRTELHLDLQKIQSMHQNRHDSINSLSLFLNELEIFIKLNFQNENLSQSLEQMPKFVSS